MGDLVHQLFNIDNRFGTITSQKVNKQISMKVLFVIVFGGLARNLNQWPLGKLLNKF